MTKDDIKRYRRRLLALKKRLGGDLSALEEQALRPVGGEAAGGLSDVPVHPADLGTDNFEEELALSLLENEEQLLEEVVDALARIDAMFASYLRKYPHNKPQFMHMASESDALGKIHAGARPDLFRPYVGWVRYFAESGLVQPWRTARATPLLRRSRPSAGRPAKSPPRTHSCRPSPKRLAR